MNKPCAVLIVLLEAVLILNVGCARKPDDEAISTDIQNRFSQDSGLSTKQLTVQANDRVVTLAGFVDNDAQRQAAARQAASVAGVKEVVNNLQVGSVSNPSTPPVVAAKNAPLTPPNHAPPNHAAPTKKPHRSEAHEKQGYSSPNDDAVAENSQPPVPADDPPLPQPAPPPPAPPQPQKVTIEQGTQVSIRLIDSIDTEKNKVGDTFHGTLNTPLSAEGAEAIPAGTNISGHIVDLRSAGKFAGQSLLVLQLDSITSNGTSYNLKTDQYRKEGSSRGKNTAEKVGGGAIVGGIIGAIAGGGKGAAIGTAAGAGVGGGAQAASKSQQIKLPSETVLSFTLQAPLTVIRPPDPNAGRQKLGDSR
ncbi:MAG TPA: BON domain-containing protein [Candidatus Eremiobacteraceae bacterium]|nr:BON domain-containing protein [Candidatus Eremiobacteraceae bacterium]